MWYLVIIVSILLAGFFIWTNMEDRKQKKKQNKKGERPLFRTEEDLEEYGKPMDSHPIDFDDAE